MNRERPGASGGLLRGRYAGTIAILYLGLLALLLVEQFVLRVPPRGYLDVAVLFAATNVVLALQRARDGLVAHGTLRSAVVGVLPVALVGTAVGGVIVALSGSEPTVVGVVACGLVFLVLFVLATAGVQYVSTRRRGETLSDD